MIYKLFLFGEKELFAYTEIFNDMNLKEGDMFYFEEKRYKILRIIRTYKRVEWDDKGYPKRQVQNATQKQFAELEAPELIITEVPAT
jgi:hypothetical protein